MNKNVYQTKYWYNHFNFVNRSINKIFHYRTTCPQILKPQNDSKGVITQESVTVQSNYKNNRTNSLIFFEVNTTKNTRAMLITSLLTGVIIVNFEQISLFVLLFLSLTLNS